MNPSGNRGDTRTAQQFVGELLTGNHLQQALVRLKALHPSAANAPLWMAAADRLARSGQLTEARQALLAASEHLPLHAPFLISLSERLIGMGEIVACRRCVALLEQAPHPPVELLKRVGMLRAQLGEHRQARSLMEKAADAGLTDPSTLFLLATQRYFHGDLDGAERVLRASLARSPLQGDAMVLLCSLRRQRSDELLATVDAGIHKLSGKQGEPGATFALAAFEYARFKILDDLGRHAEAWPALETSNRRMAALFPYDEAGGEALADALCQIAPTKSVTRSSAASASRELPTPIFVVGMPRSGTTLLDRMLSAHSEVTDAGELVDFPRLFRQMAGLATNDSLLDAVLQHMKIDLHGLGMRYREQTGWRAGSSMFYVDKLPSNILMVPFIRRALPNARIVHIARPAMDVCFSNFKAMFGNRAAFSYEQHALAHHYRQYRKVAEHWQAHWPGSVLDVAYADLVREPETEIRRVLEWCGLPFEAACMQPEHNPGAVATPSSAQVRAPIHQKAIGSWLPYAHELRPMREALREFAAG